MMKKIIHLLLFCQFSLCLSPYSLVRALQSEEFIFGSSFHLRDLQRLQTEFDRLSLAQGLSQIVVNHILQDSRGYMWFCTVDGLNKYDGYSFHLYRNNPLDANSLSHNFILTIYEDRTGVLWIGTFQGGLNRYDPVKEQFTRYLHNPSNSLTIANNIVNAICEDQWGNLWIGTESGLDRFDRVTQSFLHYKHEDDNFNTLSDDKVRSILEDEQGYLWIATNGGGLDRLDPKSNQWQHYRHDPANPNSLSHNSVRTLCRSSDGALWIGTEGGGLDRLEFKNIQSSIFKHYQYDPARSNRLSHNYINSLLEDRYGYLWIGTNGGGLDVFDYKDNIFVNFCNLKNDPNSISSNDVYSIYEDRSGVIWIGTFRGGISKLNRAKMQFAHYYSSPTDTNSLSSNFVWGIYEDENSTLWIGTYGGGLDAFDKKQNQWKHYRHDPKNSHSLNQDKVRLSFRDHYGQFWIATDGGGFAKFDRKSGSFQRYQHDPQNPNSLSHDGIRAIYEDSDGYFWIGTFGGGLNKFDPRTGKFIHYISEPLNPYSISNNYVRAILQDNSGNFWIGTEGGGLNKFVPASGKFYHFRADPVDRKMLSNDYIFSIYKDKSGNLWIGTWGGGLNKLDPERLKFSRYTEENGLADNVIYGILEDDQGSLWMSSNKGLSAFDPKTETFTNYTVDDGLQSMEFNAGSFFKSKSGEMFFGGVNGFNAFYPDSIVQNTYIPPVVITSFLKFNQPVPLEKSIADIKEIKLSYKDYFFSFEFAALDYRAPMKNSYAYMMGGLDKEWIRTDASKRFASYTTLAPGKYIFKVKASNNDGIWNDQGASIRIVIKPPFWKTWWFFSICVLVGGCIIAGIVLLRINSLVLVERVRTKIAADLHDNIGAGLTEISILGEVVQKKIDGGHPEATIIMAKISDIARSLIDSMNDIVWVIHPHRDTLYDLILKLKDTYHDLFLARDILFKTSELRVLEQVHLPMEYRHQLFLLLKEAMSNCLKHSLCNQVNLTAKVQNKELVIILSDNGQGIDTSGQRECDGLENMKKRAAAIGGELFLRANKNIGTEITFVGKITKLSKPGLKRRFLKNSPIDYLL